MLIDAPIRSNRIILVGLSRTWVRQKGTLVEATVKDMAMVIYYYNGNGQVMPNGGGK